MRTHAAFRIAAIGIVLSVLAGCEREDDGAGRLEATWGKRGVAPGRLQKPRAMAIDANDRLYIVDKTARIQVFEPDGTFVREWKTPKSEDGKPTGLTIGPKGDRLLVADTHYFRILNYTLGGELLEGETLGGVLGDAPGEFGLVTDAAFDSLGNLYVAEYGGHDRIQKFAPDGTFILQWGEHGDAPGAFRRPQNMAIDADDHIWVADACNHRIQVFDTDGKLLFLWGEQGDAPGELYYPYDLLLDNNGHVYVCEYGNHRVQKFTTDGQSLGCWGTSGRGEGELFNPWAIVRDSQGKIYVLDTNNHRVHVITI